MGPEKVRIVAMKLMVFRNQPQVVGKQKVRITAMKLIVLPSQSSSRSERETPARESTPARQITRRPLIELAKRARNPSEVDNP